MKYVIGIDIGGTNTDCVLLGADGAIYNKKKIATSHALHESVVAAIQEVTTDIDVQDIMRVAIGTTFATNAVLEAKELLPVGVIRIAGQKPALPAGYGWPEKLKSLVIKKTITIDGGSRCDGIPLNAFSKTQAEEAVKALLEAGAKALAIVGVYSPLCSHEEKVVEEIAKKQSSDLFITCSSDIGGIGFLARESASLLNASLKCALQLGFTKMEEAIGHLGLTCPIFMVKNDGSVMGIQEAIQNPILTIAAGQTNSFFGASAIAKTKNAVVIDIGGTSTDIGLVVNGIAKRSCHTASIGEVKLQFPMPDALSLAIGGGTIVKIEDGKVTLGPESVGRNLMQEAMCFGGSTLTLTDVALKAGKMTIKGSDVDKIPIDSSVAQAVMNQVEASITKAVHLMQGQEKSLSVIICGGGALIGFQEGMILPENAGFANAYGAAMAGVSHTIDQVVSLLERDFVLDSLKKAAIAKAIENGANPKHTQISHIEISPYAYSKDALARVIISASG